MKKLLFTLLVFLVTHPVTAGEMKWDIIPEDSLILFSGTQAGGVPFEGQFTAFSAALCFDERTIEDAWARLEFDVSSATTGVEERDEILQAPEWMNAAQYPAATFETENIARVGPNSYQADGVLTIKGTSNPLTLPFILDLVENTASGAFTIDRRDFNIGEGAWGKTEKWVAYAIDISFRLAATTGGEDCHDR